MEGVLVNISKNCKSRKRAATSEEIGQMRLHIGKVSLCHHLFWTIETNVQDESISFRKLLQKRLALLSAPMRFVILCQLALSVELLLTNITSQRIRKRSLGKSRAYSYEREDPVEMQNLRVCFFNWKQCCGVLAFSLIVLLRFGHITNWNTLEPHGKLLKKMSPPKIFKHF